MRLLMDNKFSLGSHGTLVRMYTGKIVIRKFDHEASFPYINHMEFGVKVTTG